MAASSEITKAKLALRITTNAFDDQIGDLLDAAAVDLHIAGVEIPETYGAIVETAKITYVATHFGEPARMAMRQPFRRWTALNSSW